MRIDFLREFITLGHVLNFGVTARQHFITEATLSKHISAMESFLGTKLFVRDTHQVRLSRAGQTFLDEVEPLVEGYDFSVAKVRALSDASSLLRVGFMPDVLSGMLPRALKWLADNAPDTSVQLSSADYETLASGLLTRKFDVILTMDIDGTLRRNCHFMALGQGEFVAVLAWDHPLAQHESLAVAELLEWPLLFPDPLRMVAMNQCYCRILGVTPNDCDVAQYCNDSSSIILSAEVGMGIGLCPSFDQKHYSGRLRFIPLSDSSHVAFETGPMWLTGKGEDTIKPLLRALESVRVQGV